MNILRKSLSRQMFLWMGAAIVVTSVAVALVMVLLSYASPGGWAVEKKQGLRFVGSQYARIWSDPLARATLSTDIANDLEMRVTLRGSDDAVLGEYGIECDSMRRFKAPVTRDGETLGSVEFCKPHPEGGLVRLIALLVTVCLVLWGLAWLLARRLGRPLRELAGVARKLGDGDLEARAPKALNEGDEIATLAASLHDMAERIDAQLRDQRALLAGVSHELRTPLQHMRLLLELNKHEELEGEIVEMDELVDQLLMSSRLDFALGDTREIDPANLAIEALERGGYDLELLEVQGTLPAMKGDTAMLRRALTNLLRNAVEHAGGIQGVVIDANQGQVRFRVQDIGDVVVPPEKFEAFQTDSGSLGMGLFLVKRIAQAHGGGVLTDAGCVGFTVAATQKPA